MDKILFRASEQVRLRLPEGFCFVRRGALNVSKLLTVLLAHLCTL